MTHRFGALVIFLYWFALASKVLFTSKNKHILSALFLVLGLLIVQLCLGISNVLLARPLLIAVSHNLIAALLLATTVRLSYLAYRFKEEMG